MREGDEHTGGCLCGAVRFRVAGGPLWTGYCHCGSCRRATGAPVAAFAGFPAGRFAYTRGTATRRSSSPGVYRSFCAACGTPLTYEGDRWPGEVHIHTGCLDAPQDFPPQGEAFAEEKLPWLRLGPTGAEPAT
ncbi:MAG: GFA family protein [Inquilinus sp.]|nr:GFA family protein [Inquilinus sp.]